MSRKRFIKLCMAKGLPRNQATEEAEFCRYLNCTYSYYYKYYLPFVVISYRMERAAKALNNLTFSVATELISGMNELSKIMNDCLVKEENL